MQTTVPAIAAAAGNTELLARVLLCAGIHRLIDAVRRAGLPMVSWQNGSSNAKEIAEGTSYCVGLGLMLD